MPAYATAYNFSATKTSWLSMNETGGGSKRWPAQRTIPTTTHRRLAARSAVAASHGQLMSDSWRDRATASSFMSLLHGHCVDAAALDVVDVLQDRVERLRFAHVVDDALQEGLVDLLGHQVGCVVAEAGRVGER